MDKLEIHVVPLLHYDNTSEPDFAMDEDKLSSSTLRTRNLAELYNPEITQKQPNAPYIIGLTGGSCSGKSSVARRISKKSKSKRVHIIDCDRLGHEAYAQGTECNLKIIDHFGEKVAHPDGSINRKELGSIVFRDQTQLKNLTDIVWPAIKTRIEQIIQHTKPDDIIILDAALLIEADWYKICNEVWLCLLDHEEQVKRIEHRDSLTAEMARKRIASQITDEQRFPHCNVFLTTMWSKTVTKRQVDKAWDKLTQRCGFVE